MVCGVLDAQSSENLALRVRADGGLVEVGGVIWGHKSASGALRIGVRGPFPFPSGDGARLDPGPTRLNVTPRGIKGNSRTAS